jgi:hypothetical protein
LALKKKKLEVAAQQMTHKEQQAILRKLDEIDAEEALASIQQLMGKNKHNAVMRSINTV